MTASDMKKAIASAIAQACKNEPKCIDQRARSFVAVLSGALDNDDPALAKALFEGIFGCAYPVCNPTGERAS